MNFKKWFSKDQQRIPAVTLNFIPFVRIRMDCFNARQESHVSCLTINSKLCFLCDALRDLVLFVQLENVKNTHGEV